MRIIIAGAGDIGFHLAELLCFENQDIVLIDTNQDVLDYAAAHLDVMTIHGDATSIQILEDAGIQRAKLLITVTTSEKTNLITAILGKKMGVKQTIARVSNNEYLCEKHDSIFEPLGIDALISPKELAAEEIFRLVERSAFTDLFEFENGKINLIGFTLNDDSPLANRKINEISNECFDISLMVIAVLRGHQTIIPRGDTILKRNDHIYFIVKKEEIEKIQRVFGKKDHKIKQIMIIGGTGLGVATAKRLEQNYNVTLIHHDKEQCNKLAEQLQRTLIINGDASNIDLLVEEGLDQMDAFIALTPNSETNIIASLTAKNHGVMKTIAQVENKEYVHISQNIGVDTLINKKLIAANNIFRFIRKGRIEAITRLSGVDAEIIEFVIHKKNQLTKKPLKELHYFPKSALIGGVIRGEQSLIPNGSFQLEVGDKVIVIAMQEAIQKIEKLFR